MSCAQPSIFAMAGCGGCGCVQAGAGRNVWSANTFIGATGPCYTIDNSNLAAWVAAYDFDSSVPWGNSLEGTFSSNSAGPDSTTTWPSNYSPNPPSRGIINTPGGRHALWRGPNRPLEFRHCLPGQIHVLARRHLSAGHRRQLPGICRPGIAGLLHRRRRRLRSGTIPSLTATTQSTPVFNPPAAHPTAANARNGPFSLHPCWREQLGL